jgi:hypothetical protein
MQALLRLHANFTDAVREHAARGDGRPACPGYLESQSLAVFEEELKNVNEAELEGKVNVRPRHNTHALRLADLLYR